MDGWNFIDGPSKPRNELRRCSEEEEKQEERVSVTERIDQFRRIIVDVLRDFPEAYRAVVERLRQIQLAGET